MTLLVRRVLQRVVQLVVQVLGKNLGLYLFGLLRRVKQE
jgi:hypothetical protein